MENKPRNSEEVGGAFLETLVIIAVIALLLGSGISLLAKIIKTEEPNNKEKEQKQEQVYAEMTNVFKSKVDNFNPSQHSFPDGSSKVKCDDTESQISNAYSLAHYIDEYKANHPTSEIPEFETSHGEITSIKDAKFADSNDFKRFAYSVSCHDIKLTTDGNNEFTVRMKYKLREEKNSPFSWITIYDSKSSESRNNLSKIAQGNQ